MSEQNNPTPPRYVTCRCQHCDGKIEFDANLLMAEDNIVRCPHCGEETEFNIADADDSPFKIADQNASSPHRHKRVRFTKGTSVALTRAQCASPTGQELINLLTEIVHEGFDADGLVTDDGVRRLNAWLDGKADTDIPAIKFLLQISDRILRTGKVTAAPAREMQRAIERVLPLNVRDGIQENRHGVWLHSYSSPEVPATKKQLQFIRDLGENPTVGVTKMAASSLIEELLAKQRELQASQQSTTPQQIDSWDCSMMQAAERKPPRYVTCRCQHCDGHIEFDANELTEENSIVPCPHCGLETKIFILVLQPEKAPTELPSSIASPNTVRHEGLFCEGGERIAQVANEQPATEVWRECQFTIVASIEQGTDAWREWRHNGIGASDASTIMGENRFKSSAQLLQEKRGPARDFGQNAAMARGTELEPEARRLYVAKTGRDVRPACLQSTRYDWLRASLDGLAVDEDAVVEIKCGQSAYRTASQTRSVPDYYYGQMQHILAVTGFDSLDFWCYWPGYPALLIPVPRNVAYIERLLNKELEFWNLVRSGR